MLRTTATRSARTSFAKAPLARAGYRAASRGTKCAPLVSRRPQVLLPLSRPTTHSSFYATKSEEPPSNFDHRDTKHEQEVARSLLEPHPDEVSSGSSVRHVFEGKQEGAKIEHGALRNDFETIKDTFALRDVPKESLYLGAAGVIPYAATSMSTVYLAFDINHAKDTGTGYLFSPELAHQLLDIVTPLQVGYGAVIISFLGAVHWGLEYAGYGGYHSYRRYMYGVIAPAVAWPTLIMPVEYALITQFTAFTFLYFADARATVRGWFPPWYSTYRFVLTFIVGASIVISLVGRGQIANKDHNLRKAVDYVKADRDAQWTALEREEKERRSLLAKQEEEEEEETEEEDEEDDSESNNDKDDSNDKKDNSDDKEDTSKDDGKEDKKDEGDKKNKK